jgi:hypothetical protein
MYHILRLLDLHLCSEELLDLEERSLDIASIACYVLNVSIHLLSMDMKEWRDIQGRNVIEL